MKERWVGYLPALLLAALAGPTYWLDQILGGASELAEGRTSTPDFSRAEPGRDPRPVRAKLLHYPGDSATWT
jgi:hypothetical protein